MEFLASATVALVTGAIIALVGITMLVADHIHVKRVQRQINR